MVGIYIDALAKRFCFDKLVATNDSNENDIKLISAKHYKTAISPLISNIPLIKLNDYDLSHKIAQSTHQFVTNISYLAG